MHDGQQIQCGFRDEGMLPNRSASSRKSLVFLLIRAATICDTRGQRVMSTLWWKAAVKELVDCDWF